MKLIDAIFLVDQMPHGATICARSPFLLSSEAVIVDLTKDHAVSEQTKAAGYTYFLEREGVAELLEMIEAKQATRNTKAEFVCHYATHDAYPAWFYDLSDQTHE